MENTPSAPEQTPIASIPPAVTMPPLSPQQPSRTWHYNAFLYLVVGVVLGSFGSYFVLLNTMSSQTKTVSVAAASPTTMEPTPSAIVPTVNEIASSASATTTYVSSTGLFSFKYPSSWESVDVSKMPGVEAALDVPLTPECQPPHNCGGFRAGIQVQTMANPQILPVPAFITSIHYDAPKEYVKNPNNFGIPGNWMINRHSNGAGSGQQAFLPRGVKMIDLYCASCDDQTFDAILSTFQFLK